MRIHEYQAKKIFRQHGIPIPKGEVAFSVDEAVRRYRECGFQDAVVKAQVLVGGRGKAGGVRKVKAAKEVEKETASLIGTGLETYQSGGQSQRVKAVLIESLCDFKHELYMGVAVNRSQGLPNLVFSECGGIEIEQVARQNPDKVQRIPLSQCEGGVLAMTVERKVV